jgi:hypothetical protein
VTRILAFEEEHFGDLKAREISPSKLTRTLSAFANAEGGDLYIGIDEDKAQRARTWRGFADPEAANSHIQVFAETIGLDEFFELQFLRQAGDSDSSLALKASVAASPLRPGWAAARRWSPTTGTSIAIVSSGGVGPCPLRLISLVFDETGRPLQTRRPRDRHVAPARTRRAGASLRRSRDRRGSHSMLMQHSGRDRLEPGDKMMGGIAPTRTARGRSRPAAQPRTRGASREATIAESCSCGALVRLTAARGRGLR